MADLLWTGASGDGVLNGAGNGLSALANADNVRFIKANTGQPGPSATMAAFTANTPNLIHVMEGYTQSIGGSGTELDTSASKVWFQGTSGKMWFKDGAGTTAWVIVDSTSSNPLGHDCFALVGATTTLLDVLRGAATVTSGTVTDFSVASRSLGNAESQLTINSGVTITTSGTIKNGIVNSNVSIPTVRVLGGTWTQATTVTGTTVLDCWGGQTNINFGGTYAKIIARPGALLDFTQDGSVKTITNLYIYPGAVLKGWTPDNNGIAKHTNVFYVS